MFYSTDILTRRGGKFGVIWLAATKARKLKKRDYFTVDITTTCDDLMQYFPQAADARVPRGRRVRMSLYLMSQLMYGVICVYKQQLIYLMADVQELHDELRTKRVTAIVIDLPSDLEVGLNINLPDPLAGVINASFGEASRAAFSSPVMGFDEQEFLSLHSALSGKETAPPRFVADAAQVTLQEDLWQLPPDLLDDDFLPPWEEGFDGEKDQMNEPVFTEVTTEDNIPEDHVKTSTCSELVESEEPRDESIIHNGPPVDETPVEPIEEIEEPPSPNGRQRTLERTDNVDETTTAPPRPMIPFVLEPLETPEPKKKKRKTPIFKEKKKTHIDTAIQISANDLMAQINDYTTNMRTHPRDEPFPWLEAKRTPLGEAEEMLRKPALGGSVVASVVKNCLRFRKRKFDDEDDDTFVGLRLEEVAPKEPVVQHFEPIPEESEGERRLTSEKDMAHVSAPSELGSKKKRVTDGTGPENMEQQTMDPVESVLPNLEMETAEYDQSPAPVSDHAAPCVSPSVDIPSPPATPFVSALQEEELLNAVLNLIPTGGHTTFDAVCPVESTNKVEAAKAFMLTLGLCRQGKIRVEQNEWYGEIIIRRGQI